jgi:acetyl-CoA acetyltransferase
MPDALILSAARTPIGWARKGSLTSVDAYELAEVAVTGQSKGHRSLSLTLTTCFSRSPCRAAG